jgi:hypothetical protein
MQHANVYQCFGHDRPGTIETLFGVKRKGRDKP